MRVSIIGAGGGIGRLVSRDLIAGGHAVNAIVRRQAQVRDLAGQGITARLGDVAEASAEELAGLLAATDVVLFTAGAGGRDPPGATAAVDGDGPAKAAAAAAIAGIRRFYLVSVFPEAWREQRMDDDFEHYMVEKKRAETSLVATGLDWLILRPSALTDQPGSGMVDLGLAKVHGEIARADVARTLVALMIAPHLNRMILELTGGTTPIHDAVSALGGTPP